MSNPIISMPHRHTVRYEKETSVIEFEVELLQDGIVFYRKGVKIISCGDQNIDPIVIAVEQWLKSKFNHVEVDDS